MALCQGCHCKLEPGRSGWCPDCADDMGSRNFDTDEPDTDDRDGELDFDEDEKGPTMPTTDDLPTCRKCGAFLDCVERRRLLTEESSGLCEDCRREELPADEDEDPEDGFAEEG